MVFNAFEQFEIAGYSFGFTVFSLVTWLLFMLVSVSGWIVGSRGGILISSLFRGILGMVYNGIGSHGGEFVGLVWSLVVMILVLNLVGLVPYSVSITSQIFVGLVLSVGIGIGRLYMGFAGMGLRMFEMMIPYGSPFAMWGFFVLIESIGLCIPGISLGLRLGVNVLAGHVLFHVLFGFTWTMGLNGGLWGVVSVILILCIAALIVMELVISCIQAYVFGLLTSVYVGELVAHSDNH